METVAARAARHVPFHLPGQRARLQKDTVAARTFIKKRVPEISQMRFCQGTVVKVIHEKLTSSQGSQKRSSSSRVFWSNLHKTTKIMVRSIRLKPIPTLKFHPLIWARANIASLGNKIRCSVCWAQKSRK
jgi:hypothetical protein